MNANDIGCRGIVAQSAVSHSVIISVAAEIPPNHDRFVLKLGANRLDVLQTIPHPRPRMNPIPIAQKGAREVMMNQHPTVRKKTGSKTPYAMISEARHSGIGGLMRTWRCKCSFSVILSMTVSDFAIRTSPNSSVISDRQFRINEARTQSYPTCWVQKYPDSSCLFRW
jgi:hypothetical protein